MSLVFDVIILAVCVTSIVLGVKRGFIKSIMGVCTLIAALCLAYAFTPMLAGYIRTSAPVENISASIGDTIKSLSKNDEDSYNLEKMFDDMPDAFQQILQRYGASEHELVSEIPPEQEAPETVVDELAGVIADPVADAISKVVAFLAIFVVSVILLKLLTLLLDLLFQLPVLKTANKMLGFVMGAVVAIFWIAVLCPLSITLIRALSSISPNLFNESVIDNSVILSFFVNNKIDDLLNQLLG